MDTVRETNDQRERAADTQELLVLTLGRWCSCQAEFFWQAVPTCTDPFFPALYPTLILSSLFQHLFTSIILLSCCPFHWFYSSPHFTSLSLSLSLSLLFSSAMINRYSSQINRAFVETPHWIDYMYSMPSTHCWWPECPECPIIMIKTCFQLEIKCASLYLS